MEHRVSKRTGKFDGLDQAEAELREKFDLVLTRKPYKISENIIFLGEIERSNDFEKGQNLPMIDKDGKTYQHLDDSGVVLKMSEGIFVISGCAHSGICNTIEYAKKITKTEKVQAVMGGFHLKEVNEQTTKTIDYFVENKIARVYLAHCTSDAVCEEFSKRIPGRVEVLGSGVEVGISE